MQNCVCFYSILGLTRPPNGSAELSQSSISKLYHKLLLLVHPDKNCADMARETSVFLIRAVQVLRDKNKEAKYRRGVKSNSKEFLHDCTEAKGFIRYLRQLKQKAGSPLKTNDSSSSSSGTSSQSQAGRETPSNHHHGTDSPPQSCWDEAEMDYETHGGSRNADVRSQRSRSPSPATMSQEVERILNHEIRPSGVWFRVKWRDYDVVTREKLGFMLNHRLKLKEYLIALRRLSKRRYSALTKKDTRVWKALQENQ